MNDLKHKFLRENSGLLSLDLTSTDLTNKYIEWLEVGYTSLECIVKNNRECLQNVDKSIA